MRKTKRSTTVRIKFLANRGLKRSPKGKVVAHKKALVFGGKDDPRNLMLKKKSTHKKETRKLLRKLARKRRRG
jgi:hypothetical protein